MTFVYNILSSWDNNKGAKMKKYKCKVPCYIYYEVTAKDEDEARRIILEEAGITIDGELCFDDNAYKDAELTQIKGEK